MYCFIVNISTTNYNGNNQQKTNFYTSLTWKCKGCTVLNLSSCKDCNLCVTLKIKLLDNKCKYKRCKTLNEPPSKKCFRSILTLDANKNRGRYNSRMKSHTVSNFKKIKRGH